MLYPTSELKIRVHSETSVKVSSPSTESLVKKLGGMNHLLMPLGL